MALLLTRIDDRLIHGQVVEGWIPYLKADFVLVAADAVAADETQVTLMRLAVPEAVGLEVLSVEAAAGHPALSPSAPERTLVLAPGPREVLELLEKGLSIPKVNVGGLHYAAGRVQLGKAIFLSDEDRLALRRISDRGVRLEGRALPSEKEVDVIEMIGCVGGTS